MLNILIILQLCDFVITCRVIIRGIYGYQEKFGQKIQKLRKSKKIIQEELAETIGIESKSISRIENSNTYPSAETLCSIAKTLNVDIYELFVFNEICYDKMKSEIINFLNDKKNILYLYNCLKFSH